MSVDYSNYDEWGWFVDIESSTPAPCIKKKILIKIPSIKLNANNDKSEIIKKEKEKRKKEKEERKKEKEEINKEKKSTQDVLNSYIINKKYKTDSNLKAKMHIIATPNQYYTSTNLLKIGSVTICTLVLTYAIIFVL